MSFQHTLRYLLSFIYPILIEKIPSQINGDLELSLQNGKLVVDSELANYSYGSLHDVFRKIIKEIHFAEDKRQVLILGFGAGSIATILNKEKALQVNIDGVDLDSVLFEIYKKHFVSAEQDCKLYEDDVIHYLENCQKSYDYIFIDVFVNLDVPKTLRTQYFLDLLQKVSTPATQIAMNTMLKTDDDFVKAWMNEFDTQAKIKRYHSDNLVLFKKI
jgi:ubiquinone/menaquinone biosynthesis C-methylase UbiE